MLMIDPVILSSLIGAFTLLLALSAYAKLNDLAAFQSMLENYQLMPPSATARLSKLIFAAEGLAAALLLTPAYVYGLVITAALLFAYTVGIAINLVRGRTHIDCGCLGSHGEGISQYHVLRNLALLACLATCLLPVASRELIWVDYATIIAFVAASCVAYITANLLIAHVGQHRLWWS